MNQNKGLVEVNVKEFKTLFEGTKDVIFYTIEMKSGDKKWLISKRFSALKNLQEHLKINHSNLPIFPKKSFFALTKYEDIDGRRKKLDYFFKLIFQRPDMYKNIQFLGFFEIRDKLNITSHEYLKLGVHLENKSMGFRDVFYDVNQDIFITLLGDMNSISRLDSYVTNNLKLPWEEQNKDEIYFSVGLLEFYVVKPKSQVKFQKKFNLSFPYQVICVDYNAILNTFCVGTDDGVLYGYQVDKANKMKYTEILKEKIHGRRIMGVCIDGMRNIVYSVAEDGLMQTTCLKQKKVLGSKIKSDQGFIWKDLQLHFSEATKEIIHQ